MANPQPHRGPNAAAPHTAAPHTADVQLGAELNSGAREGLPGPARRTVLGAALVPALGAGAVLATSATLNGNTVTAAGTTATLTGVGIGAVLGPALHPKFVNPLPKPARVDATTAGTRLTMQLSQSRQWIGLVDAFGNRVMSDVWGIHQAGQPATYQGATIVARKGVPVEIEWQNTLPGEHLFDLSHSTHHRPHVASGTVPTVIHLHGAHVAPEYDGHPLAWFTQGYAETGPHFTGAVNRYGNDQDACTLWYHDHTIGITRLGVYAGLVGMYLVRDDVEDSLGLPSGQYERELILQDLQINPDGSLARQNEFPAFFGEYLSVNGMLWPYLEVEPRPYRFRLVNGSDSRFYDLALSGGVPFTQIGTEGGLLGASQRISHLPIAPGERYDLIVDFSAMAGATITMTNSEGIVPGTPNVTPSTGSVMQFRVKRTATSTSRVPSTLRKVPAPLGSAVVTRRLLVAQSLDLSPMAMLNAPIIDLLGTLDQGMLGFMDPVTETPRVNEVEIWELYNTSLVSHVIHIHQVFFQILDRQPIVTLDSPAAYYGDSRDRRAVHPLKVGWRSSPAIHERGAKDEVIVGPEQVARVRIRFDIPGEYVWHCHLLSHEDHDMMRPLTVRR